MATPPPPPTKNKKLLRSLVEILHPETLHSGLLRTVDEGHLVKAEACQTFCSGAAKIKQKDNPNPKP